jgi:dolichyl-phosphate beta-glucosyltransferase
LNSPETELIFVDDGSGDGTTTLLEDWVGKMGERCSLKKLSKNIGKGFAVRAGLKLACGDYVAYTDADLPYGLDILAQMLGVLQKNQIFFCSMVREFTLYPQLKLIIIG